MRELMLFRYVYQLIEYLLIAFSDLIVCELLHTKIDPCWERFPRIRCLESLRSTGDCIRTERYGRNE